MWSVGETLQHFFTHKDFLPSPDGIPGTLFDTLHLLVAAVLTVAVLGLAVWLSRTDERTVRTVMGVLWAAVTVAEIVKIVWETCAGAQVRVEWGGILPLYPCSIFMYAMPFAIWGRGLVRHAACGYVCTLGLLGGAVNFFYPATVLGNYSCLSFAGVHTLVYHGAIVFCALTMLFSRYHRYTGVTRAWQLLLPAVPFLIVSVAANAVNFSSVGSDYMFFRLNSMFFTPLGAATPDALGVLLVYAAYLLIHALPYLPSFVAGKLRKGASR